MLVDHKIAFLSLILHLLLHKHNGITISPTDIGLKTKLPNGIKIYKNKKTIKQIINLVNKYPFI